jgi:uncharacterized protein YndB with AHSA1/START domain
MTDTMPTEPADDRNPLLTRVFDAPRKLVFKVWTDPDQVAKWWGPSGFETPRGTVTIEPRVGGRYELCMVQIDNGAKFWVRNEILELVEPELLVLRSEPMPEMGVPEPVITRVQLQDDGGRTRMSLSRPYRTERRAGAQVGWSSSLDKLEKLLDGFA